MNYRPLFPTVVGAVILVALSAGAADAWHGSGTITALAIDPITPTTLYAGTCEGGLFRSRDGGVSWAATGLNTIYYVFALAVDPQTPNTLYAAAGGYDCTRAAIAGTFGADVYKSTDGGASWNVSGLTGAYINALAIDRQTPTTLYAGADWGGVFKSVDGGASWNQTGLGPFMTQSLVIDPVSSQTLYAADASVSDEGFAWYGDVYKTTDGTATWSAVGHAGGYFDALAIDPRFDRDPATPATVYAAGLSWDKGVFKSSDGGTTWSVASLPDLIDSVAIDPQTPTTLYAGVDREGALKSTDGGATWTAINTGLTDVLLSLGVSPGVRAVAIDPVTPSAPSEQSRSIYAGTSIGVFKSTDGGASWRPTGLFRHSPLSSVNLDPTSVPAGSASTGTLTLITAAPVGGVTVVLSSSDPAVASVPETVTVPAGSTSATFKISTSSSGLGGATISAALDDSKASAELTVTPAVTLSSLSLDPGSVAGGRASIGTVMLTAAAPATGTVVTLASSNVSVATVPAAVTVPAGTISTRFTGFTVGCASGTVTISGTSGGAVRSADLVVTTAPDTIAIQAADYFATKRELAVAAKSTNSTAALRAYVTSTAEFIGQLIKAVDGTYRGRFAWPVDPKNITVRSSACGSGTKAVTSK